MLQQLGPANAHATDLVQNGMNDLRWDVVYLGFGITGAVTLLLSGLWGWLIWRLRRKERQEEGAGG